MIDARELTKRYGGTTVVHALSFTIAPGTATGRLGPNGAGKSTTMRMIMGLDPSSMISTMDSSHTSCRLSVDGPEAEVVGAPDALDHLAEHLQDSPDEVVVAVAGGRVGIRPTAASCLKISIEGTTLWIEGSQSARNLVFSAMRDVAQESRELGRGPISRHRHLEYLGAGDQWRDPTTFPLVISAD